MARAGTFSGAARALGVNHSTVFRRIGAFERLPGGYVLTPAGEEMQAAALRLEEEMAALVRRASGQDLRLSGPVRLPTGDLLALKLLP